MWGDDRWEALLGHKWIETGTPVLHENVCMKILANNITNYGITIKKLNKKIF